MKSGNTQDLKQLYIRQNYEKMLCIVFVLCHINKKLTQLHELYWLGMTKLMTYEKTAILRQNLFHLRPYLSPAS